MKNINKVLFLMVALAVLGAGQLRAEKSRNVVSVPRAKSGSSAQCLPATNSNELTINNVRAYLETNGTMWYVEVAEYEVPKGSGKTSMFCAALWIGGRDVNQQLKLAAVRFRQYGDDFFTGPLSTIDASVSQETCIEYDRFFKITRAQVENHIANWEDPSYTPPSIITNWPAHGDVALGQSLFLAPFYDADGDKEYHPENGDYPYYDLENELCPWTDENIARAAADELPKTPEEEAGISKGMIYADHVLKGDETLFWIFNDKGAPHTESQGEPIGLEIRGQAFAFSTNNELNNMTFYSYEIINRSSFELTNTYFSQWVDPDLGYSRDDYVGCDVARGLGYCYNGTDIDGQGQTFAYGEQPPAVGVDFFQGPYMDADGYDNPAFAKETKLGPSFAYVENPCDIVALNETELTMSWGGENNDSISKKVMVRSEAINGVNFGDGIVDNERFGMRRFVYHNNDGSVTGDPSVAFEYYNMLQAIWRDNTRMRYGGNGHPQGGGTGPECDFMFPGTTDPCNWGTKGIDPQDPNPGKWVETTVPNPPEDRRFMQSAGPFTLKAGAVNYITVGIPWARAASGGAWASVELLKIADDKCQSLFENCFKVLDGPDAPDMTIRELENELVLYLTNEDPMSNNVGEKYEETDNQIPEFREFITYKDVLDTVYVSEDTVVTVEKTIKEVTQIENDRKYRFEGYQIYQLKNKNVSVTDLDNADLARLIRQCDVENYRENGTAIGQLTNWIYNDAISQSVATGMVDGSNTGIVHSFSITEDAFATGARQLVNHKTYYFMVLAYAYNEYLPYSNANAEGLEGQMTPYLAGRRNIAVYSGIPHKTMAQEEGLVLNSAYGTQPMITRVEGQGNGGFFLDLTDETREKILNENKVQHLTYKNNYGPLNIKVVDPLRVKPFDFEIKFVENGDGDVTESTKWKMSIVDATDEEIIAAGLYYDERIGETTQRKPLRDFYSDTTIAANNDQLILELGLAVSIRNQDFKIYQKEVSDWIKNDPATPWNYVTKSKYGQVDFLGSTITYADESKPWLGGVADGEGDYPDNWIRAGQQTSGAWQDVTNQNDGVKDNFSEWLKEDMFFVEKNAVLNPSGWETRIWKDPNGQFESSSDKLWAPYVLSSPYFGGPQAKYMSPYTTFNSEPLPAYFDFRTTATVSVNAPGYNQTMTNLYSVDVVLTPDKSKWTRCVVLEACETQSLADGQARRHEPRRAPSVDKEGRTDTGNPYPSDDPNSPNFISATGMGWFPGYAINVETGERLNIMFSENSSDTANNGRDMLFNPTSFYGHAYIPQLDSTVEASQSLYNNYFLHTEGAPVSASPSWGGMHFVYICNSAGNTASSYLKAAEIREKRTYNDDDKKVRSWSYDHGGTIAGGLSYYDCGAYDHGKWLIEKFKTFVSDDPNSAPSNPVRQQKMQLFNNVMWTSIAMPAYNQEDNWLSNEAMVKLRVSRPYMRYLSRWYNDPEQADGVSENRGFPMYRFTTKNIAPVAQATSVHETILKEINIVPNPYYGFSTYESTQLETYVKIVNLPEKCTISIFTVNGLLVRKISKGDLGTTHVTWDLKNHANVPVASGMYIIHVDAPGIGERTLKFFCAMRPTDLNAF
ncbi:hypothetical protein LJC68_02275 [Bacteroidales bacterium OttesenSCG-928-B11]|nr:hypothetical protein [Bacteroidales bacterium OttesenSCG-928-B11]MDL2325741.1 hypothetical protein [Bacteroidales bacterium OttesenSCG-928-A14]